MHDPKRSKSLRSLSFPTDVDTSMVDVDQVLMNPCLGYSVAYDCGVGYFTSIWLKRVALGGAGFAQNGGKMRHGYARVSSEDQQTTNRSLRQCPNFGR